jgi:hypothetical protein
MIIPSLLGNQSAKVANQTQDPPATTATDSFSAHYPLHRSLANSFSSRPSSCKFCVITNNNLELLLGSPFNDPLCNKGCLLRRFWNNCVHPMPVMAAMTLTSSGMSFIRMVLEKALSAAFEALYMVEYTSANSPPTEPILIMVPLAEISRGARACVTVTAAKMLVSNMALRSRCRSLASAFGRLQVYQCRNL